MAVRIQVLGSLRAWRDGAELVLGPPGRRAVLGLLVLGGGETVTMRDLVDALWGDRPPRSAVNVLQTHVKHLRRILEPDRPARTGSGVLPYVNGGYAVNQEAVDVDLLHVRRLLTEANGTHGDPARVAELLGEVLRLWHGPPLADLPFLATQPKIVALVAERREVLARYGDAMIATGAVAEVLPEVAAAAAAEPLNEAFQARLIRAYHVANQRAMAFQVYHAVRDRLVEELGVDPGPDLRAAHAALLNEAVAPVAEPRPAHRVPRQLPAEPPGFTGRTHQLSTLDSLVPAAGTGGVVTIAAISGSAGVGKTALAVHWAHRVRDRFPDGQLYANLRGHAHGQPVQPTEVLTQFLSALGIPAERTPADLETASALYRTMMTDRKTLVLLDNVAGPDQVRPLLPASPGCMVVVTGRGRMSGLVAMHGAHQLTLDVLSPDEALELLGRVLGQQRVRAEPAAAEFAKLCVYLPLALRIAAANLADHPWRGIEDYVLELREGNLLTALTAQGDEQIAVRAAFDLSYAALPDAARRLFRLLSLVPGTDVSTEAVAALADTTQGEAARLLDRLAGAHLVEHHASGRYRFHDLLRLYAAERAEQEEHDREAAMNRLYDWYLHALDGAARLLYPHMLRLPVPESAAPLPAGVTDLAAASNWLDAERANLVAIIRHAGSRPVAWLLADAMRGYFWMCMRKVDWQAAAEAGLAAAEAAGDQRAQAASRLSLADLNFRHGRSREAVRHHTHALLHARRAGWLEAEAAVHGNLGLVHRRSGRLAGAAMRFERGLELSRAIGHPAGEAVALGNLGLVHWEMGRLAQAAEHHAEALRWHRRVGSWYGEALSLSLLGQVQRSRGQLAEAVELLVKALELYREAGARAGEAEAHSRLAATYVDLGRRAEALEHARTGLALAREAGDPRATAEALATIAAVHHRLGHRSDAISRYGQALELIRETGDRYPEADALIGLSVALGDAGHARHALVLAERAGFRALQGQAMTALAEIHLALRKPADAFEHARHALAIHRETGHRLGEARTLAVLKRAPRSP